MIHFHFLPYSDFLQIAMFIYIFVDFVFVSRFPPFPYQQNDCTCI